MTAVRCSETVVCNLCAHSDAALLFVVQGRRVVRCRECGLVYIDRWSRESLYQDATYFTERNRYMARLTELRGKAPKTLSEQDATSIGLSVLIVTKDEESNIGHCLESVKWADEIIVVDSFSTDRTVEICREYTDKIFQREWSGYSSQKNYGQTLAAHDWILSLDADERATPELRKEIEAAIRSSWYAAYRIPIRDYCFGRWIYYGALSRRQRHKRLYRKSVSTWTGVVHEEIQVDGDVGQLTQPLLHYSHASVREFMDKMNHYTDLDARALFEEGVRPMSWWQMVLRFHYTFFKSYLWYQGLRDGAHGFILSLLIAFNYFMVRVKLWELWYRQAENQRRQQVKA